MIPYKLLDWIPESYICFGSLSENPRAIRILEKNLDKINWRKLSSNTEAIHLLEKNIDKIDWENLSSNPAAIHILEKNPEKIDWINLSSNPAAIHILEKNIDKIIWGQLATNTNPSVFNILKKHLFKWCYYDWYGLCENPHTMYFIEMEWKATKILDWFYGWVCCCRRFNSTCNIRWSSLCLNTSPAAIRLLEDNPDKIVWTFLSRNPAAIRLLEENPDKIDWFGLSSNPAAIHLLENEIRTNPYNRIDWCYLSRNPGAIRILEKYPERVSLVYINENTNPEAMRIIETQWKLGNHVNWFTFMSKNPYIFTYDYDEMRRNKMILHEELIQNVFHPDNMEKFEDWGFSIGLEKNNK